MSPKKRRSYSQKFKAEAVKLIIEKRYSIAEASRNMGIEYSVLRRWKKQLGNLYQPDPPAMANKPPNNEKELEKLRTELARVTEERNVLKKALAFFIENNN